MAKKDCCSLLDMHYKVFEKRLQYKSFLKNFIAMAFEMHGREFEYKCKTHSSWKAMSKDGECCFSAPDDLGIYVSINDRCASPSDLHLTRIRLKEYEGKDNVILADGFNWTEDTWQKNRAPLMTLSNLESIADFIKVVLEQEKSCD